MSLCLYIWVKEERKNHPIIIHIACQSPYKHIQIHTQFFNMLGYQFVINEFTCTNNKVDT